MDYGWESGVGFLSCACTEGVKLAGWVDLVHLVYLVYSVCLVCLVGRN
jgi:hypothetical protein